jgi:hypothetical protein
MKQQVNASRSNFKLTAIRALISIVIIFLTAANGIFTYSGAYMYLEECNCSHPHPLR